MKTKFFEEKRPHRGMSYVDYWAKVENELSAVNETELNAEERERLEYTKLNRQRSLRIGRTYRVPESLRSLVERITEPQLWMVLTEPWCGDSAQCLPYLAKIAKCNPIIDLRIPSATSSQ